MSTVNVRELLAAAVDGELTPSERKAVDRVLRESGPARALFARLQADAHRVRALPRLTAPAELAANVMGQIEDRAMRPTPLPPRHRHASRFRSSMLPMVMNLATAASVLLVISAGSFVYFSSSHDYYARQQSNLAKKNTTGLDKGADQALPRYTPAQIEAKADLAANLPEHLVVRPRIEGPEIGPRPRVVPADFLVGPEHEATPIIETFDPNKIRVSQLFALDELPGDEAARKKLTGEMVKDELIRLDLFCQASPKAFERVVTELKALNITVLVDAFVQDRLKKKLPTEVMIFTETLSPAEVTKLMTILAQHEAKIQSTEFSTLVAAPFMPLDLVRLGKLLGIANVLPKPAKGMVMHDIRKPLPEGTANQVAASLSRLANPTLGSRNEKVAVAVAYSPMQANPNASKEIKQFLDRRGLRVADAKPLMLVLRTQ